MLNYRNLNILFFSVLAVIIVAEYFFSQICFLPVFVLVAVYLALIAWGSSKIQLDFYFTSLHRGNTEKKEIALTFDDGPHPEFTPMVLDLLDKYQVKATFFCIGKQAEQHPDIVSAATEKNHLAGNHSYSHSLLFDLFSPRKMENELNRTTEIILQTTGKKPKLFRPPYGVTNPLLKKALKKTGLVSVGWSVRSFDTVKSTEQVLEKLKRETHPGAIILLHDTHEKIIPILTAFLPWLVQNGYGVVPLDDLLKIQAYESN
ncbi:MAG: polysaccharide deacetylase family protein [Bacteroidetes bacterium]|nr:MAG: polysaccharide deacetylase family protein [Bacteroidota bacterium]